MNPNNNYATPKVALEKEGHQEHPEEHKHTPTSSDTSFKIEALALKPNEFYSNRINMSSGCLLKPRETYEKLGQHKYKTGSAEGIGELTGTNEDGEKWVYVGQFEKDSDAFDGIGI